MTAAENRLLKAIDGWAQARFARLSEHRKMTAFRCEYQARPEPEVGDDGVPKCYRGGGPRDEWCEPCQSRDKLYNTYWLLKRIDRERFRLVCGMLDRREKSRLAASAPAQQEPDR